MTLRTPAPDRRRALIDATLSIIAERGFAETTVARICDAAGVSRGLISHYFAGKDALLLEAYRRLSHELAAETAKAMNEGNGDPMSSLRALVEVSFRPPVFEADKIAAWLAFWSAARGSAAVNALNRELYRGYRAAVTRLMAEAARQRGAALDAHRAATALTALIDGLWLEHALDPEAFGADQAEAACLDYLDRLFPKESQKNVP
ncbi:MAG: transcriptional regulator BetI [Proteobacteria bacterium]|nr:transcriptional regulator BetI [Pseudomonadota bacterium]